MRDRLFYLMRRLSAQRVDPHPLFLEEAARAFRSMTMPRPMSEDRTPSSRDGSSDDLYSFPGDLPSRPTTTEEVLKVFRSLASNVQPHTEKKAAPPVSLNSAGQAQQDYNRGRRSLGFDVFGWASSAIWQRQKRTSSDTDTAPLKALSDSQAVFGAEGDEGRQISSQAVPLEGPSVNRLRHASVGWADGGIRNLSSSDQRDCGGLAGPSDGPYGFSREGSCERPASSPIALSSPRDWSGPSPRGGDLSWRWVPFSEAALSGGNRVHAALECLKVQVVFCEVALEELFRGLHVDLLSPFGTACPNPRCRHPLSLYQLRAGWSTDCNRYTMTCPICEREFIPRFTVHSESSDWIGSAGRGSILWSAVLNCSVAYHDF